VLNFGKLDVAKTEATKLASIGVEILYMQHVC